MRVVCFQNERFFTFGLRGQGSGQRQLLQSAQCAENFFAGSCLKICPVQEKKDWMKKPGPRVEFVKV